MCQMCEQAAPSTRKASPRKLPMHPLRNVSAAAPECTHFPASGIAGKSCQSAAPSLCPKLGDFRKLYHRQRLGRTSQRDQVNSSALANCTLPCHDIQHLQSSSSSVFKLGDFTKVQQELREQIVEPRTFTSNKFTSSAVPKSVCDGDRCQKPRCCCRRDGHVSDSQKPNPKLYCHQPLAQSRTSPLKIDTDLLHILKNTAKEVDSRATTFLKEPERNSHNLMPSDPHQASSTALLSYMAAHHGSVLHIRGAKFSLEQKRESLSIRLVTLRAEDSIIKAGNKSIALNGVHVFLDMSNIHISFQYALRHKYSIQKNARLVPLPQLNLEFLTEILVRDRRTVTLTAGCSILPNRQEPRFVQELRKLGYRVDLRERKRVTEGEGDICSSDETSPFGSVARFMEDLVDETLQIRIAESVMEYFQYPGTLVIATGDAQPAKYSDGFFTYAERALRMGWYVEVISWSMSLSSRWQKSGFANRWGDRFRVIRLDDFLHELLT